MEIKHKIVNEDVLFSSNSLYRVLKEFLTSNTKEANSAFIGGGAARYLYDGKSKFGDIDIYLTNSKIDPYIVTSFLERKCRAKGIEVYYQEKRGVPTLESPGGGEIQIINFKYPASAEELFSSYDFTCCQFALFKNVLVFTPEAERDYLSKTLMWTEQALDNLEGVNLVNRFWRVQKYLQKGYKLGEHQGDLFFKMPWVENDHERMMLGVTNQSSGSDRSTNPAASINAPNPFNRNWVSLFSDSTDGQENQPQLSGNRNEDGLWRVTDDFGYQDYNRADVGSTLVMQRMFDALGLEVTEEEERY